MMMRSISRIWHYEESYAADTHSTHARTHFLALSSRCRRGCWLLQTAELQVVAAAMEEEEQQEEVISCVQRVRSTLEIVSMLICE